MHMLAVITHSILKINRNKKIKETTPFVNNYLLKTDITISKMSEKYNYEIKPLGKKDKDRLNSAIKSHSYFIICFVVIFSIVIFVFLSSNASILFISICILFILGLALLVLSPIIKDINRTKSTINKNEKHCGNGYVTKKIIKMIDIGGEDVLLSPFYFINIDNIEYQISESHYKMVNEEDYVYYEFKPPLYTEIKKITTANKV